MTFRWAWGRGSRAGRWTVWRWDRERRRARRGGCSLSTLEWLGSRTTARHLKRKVSRPRGQTLARFSPGVFSKNIAMSKPRNEILIDAESESSQSPEGMSGLTYISVCGRRLTLTRQSWEVWQIGVSFHVFLQLVAIPDGEQPVGSHENAGVAIGGVETVRRRACRWQCWLNSCEGRRQGNGGDVMHNKSFDRNSRLQASECTSQLSVSS